MKLGSHSISLVRRRASPSSDVAVQLPRDSLSCETIPSSIVPASVYGWVERVRLSHGEEFFTPARHLTFPESFLCFAYTHAIAHSQFRLAPTGVASVYPLSHSLLVRWIDTRRSHSNGAMIRFVV